MAQAAMTVRMDNQQKAQFDKLCEQFGMSANTAINPNINIPRSAGIRIRIHQGIPLTFQDTAPHPILSNH